jgi:hypothetical protein
MGSPISIIIPSRPRDQIPCPGLTLTTSMAVAGVRRDLLVDVLALDAFAMAQRQHDGADHGHQQHQPAIWKKKM